MKTAPLIAYHARKDNTGWREVCRHPADWNGWHPFDRSMIDEIFKTGTNVITCGWNMYQLIEAKQCTPTRSN
jgi:hypothetical protein